MASESSRRSEETFYLLALASLERAEAERTSRDARRSTILSFGVSALTIAITLMAVVLSVELRDTSSSSATVLVTVLGGAVSAVAVAMALRLMRDARHSQLSSDEREGRLGRYLRESSRLNEFTSQPSELSDLMRELGLFDFDTNSSTSSSTSRRSSESPAGVRLAYGRREYISSLVDILETPRATRICIALSLETLHSVARAAESVSGKTYLLVHSQDPEEARDERFDERRARELLSNDRVEVRWAQDAADFLCVQYEPGPSSEFRIAITIGSSEESSGLLVVLESEQSPSLREHGRWYMRRFDSLWERATIRNC
jgi:hypothetical protein